MPGRSVEVIAAPAKGLNSAAAPDAVARNQAAELANMLPGTDGMVRLRGRIGNVVRTPTGITVPSLVTAWVNESAKIGSVALLQRAAVSDSTYAELGISNGTAASFTFTGSIYASPTSSAMLAMSRGAQLGTFTYGGVTASHNTSPFEHTTLMAKWKPDETSAGGTGRTFVEVTNAPRDFAAVIVHLNRLFVLDGSVPGTTTPAKTGALYWSDLNGPLNSTLADWQDDVSGLVNQAQFTASDQGVGMAHVGRDLALLMRRSIWLLRGQTPSSFQLQQFTSEFGCVSDASILEYGSGFFFASDHGYMYCDGLDVKEVSEPIRSEFLAMLDDAATTGAYRRSVTASYVGNSTIMVSGGNSIAPKTWLYHVPSGTWTTVTSAVLASTGTAWSNFRVAGTTCLWDGSRALTANDITGTTDIFYGLDSGDAGDYYRVPGKIHSRLARLSSPFQRSTIERVMVDYMLESDNPVDGWSIQLRDGKGTVLLPWQTLPTKDDADPDLKRLRHAIEVFAESHDLQVELELRGGPLVAGSTLYYNICEVYDAWVMFQTANEFVG